MNELVYLGNDNQNRGLDVGGEFVGSDCVLVYCDYGQIPCDVLISVKLPAAPQGPTVKVAGKQAAVTTAADTPVFDVTPARCTIQPGSHVFTTVTFSPLALQVQPCSHTHTHTHTHAHLQSLSVLWLVHYQFIGPTDCINSDKSKLF